MSNQEQTKGGKIQLDKWPVSFSEWIDEYIAQILKHALKNNTDKGKKDFRESVLDKLAFRVRLVLGTFLEDVKQGKESADWVLGEMARFYLEDDHNKELHMQWWDDREQEVIKSFERYCEYEEYLQEYHKKFEKKYGDKLENWFWNRNIPGNLEKYIDTMCKLGAKVEIRDNLEEQWKEREEEFSKLDAVDFLKTFAFKSVTKEESDFYCILLEELLPTRYKMPDLKENKWWVVDIGVREKLLQSIEQLMTEEKWSFLETDFYLIAMKLLRPHEYILTKEAVTLLNRVSDLYAIGESKKLCFWNEETEDDKSEACLEIEYSDILDLEMQESLNSEEVRNSKGKRILELAENMKVFSRELGDFIEENETRPDLNKELEKYTRHIVKIGTK